MSEPAALERGDVLFEVPARTCWYGGSCRGPYEREHQKPISRGGVPRDPTVDSCQFHNRLKANRSLEEFRADVAAALGLEAVEVVFAGEASPGRPPTDIAAVTSLADDRGGVRLYPDADGALRRLQALERRLGLPRVSLTALASALVVRGVEARQAELGIEALPGLGGDGDEWAPSAPRPVIAGLQRVIRVDDSVHDDEIAAVLFLRTRGRPAMRLLDGTNEAIESWVHWVRNTYNGGRPLPPVSAYDEAEVRHLRVSPNSGGDEPVRS